VVNIAKQHGIGGVVTFFSDLTIALYSLVSGGKELLDFATNKTIDNLIKYFVTYISVMSHPFPPPLISFYSPEEFKCPIL